MDSSIPPSLSRKRANGDTESPIQGLSTKRHQTVPKSPKTSIRDASEALIQAIKTAEEAFQQPQPTLAPLSDEISEVRIVGIFSTLEDANASVRNHCSIYAKRDEPDANFKEGRTIDGRIYYETHDAGRDGFAVEIVRQVVNPLGLSRSRIGAGISESLVRIPKSRRWNLINYFVNGMGGSGGSRSGPWEGLE
ncbi:uncharacterized protein L3040_005578 [Drepanopeziza brunnea f. sp. 'multigermtubi']|uniref:Uncharacterized protein n=1 Tax=Marssonina brunnea f. sp. multigermtubi (strain MB_m1) TaxID=1072389 RepID=K1XMV5_MARBU|nr:uncharacterized protein MBM_08005 [Drepanopeziza brunnea f. sp. 'multigermtubi' MB_m1]EKD13804.1 hypothetical protein MBM_08005 [Drepanopeziza brunnea f. sp. 'multigermtubi' MB_m1]KAJ5041021.1 hypothetical protein L3040_005578 [Drepanopeziza brunnea f. sp. 'multigermtubi']